MNQFWSLIQGLWFRQSQSKSPFFQRSFIFYSLTWITTLFTPGFSWDRYLCRLYPDVVDIHYYIYYEEFFFGGQMVIQSPAFPICRLPWPGQHWLSMNLIQKSKLCYSTTLAQGELLSLWVQNMEEYCDSFSQRWLKNYMKEQCSFRDCCLKMNLKTQSLNFNSMS